MLFMVTCDSFKALDDRMIAMYGWRVMAVAMTKYGCRPVASYDKVIRPTFTE